MGSYTINLTESEKSSFLFFCLRRSYQSSKQTMKSAMTSRLIFKLILSILLIQLIPDNCFIRSTVTVVAIFEEARAQLSGKVIRVALISVIINDL